MTSMLLSIILKIDEPQYTSEHHVLFHSEHPVFSSRTPDLSYFDLLNMSHSEHPGVFITNS
jgi:hypothetical protein